MRQGANCVALSIAAGLAFAANATAAAPAVGEIAGMTGSCTIGNYPARSGDPVHIAENIGVPPGCVLKLQMSDQTTITAAPGTNLIVTRYDTTGGARDVELRLPQGLLRLVVPATAGTSHYVVATAAGSVAMRSVSGDWFIEAQARSIQAGVLAGDVVVAGASGGRSVVVPAHWGTRLEAGLEPVLPRTWGQVEFDGFIRRTQCCASPAPKTQ